MKGRALEFSEGAYFERVKAKDTEAVERSLDAGIDPDGMDGGRYTALPHAAELLEALGVPKDDALALALIAAATRGDSSEIDSFVEGGADLCIKDWDRVTALEAAAFGGHAGAVKRLIEAGAPKHVMDGKWLRIGGADSGTKDELRGLLLGLGPSDRPDPALARSSIARWMGTGAK